MQLVTARELLGLRDERNARPGRGGFPLVSTEPYQRLPFYGHQLHEVRTLDDGTPDDFYPIIRTKGWAVVVPVIDGGPSGPEVLVNLQWKQGTTRWDVELPAGGIDEVDRDLTTGEIADLTLAKLTDETGYSGKMLCLGDDLIDSGKQRGPRPDSQGMRAYMFLATDLSRVAEPKPLRTDRYTLHRINLRELLRLTIDNEVRETSARSAILLAAVRLGYLTMA